MNEGANGPFFFSGQGPSFHVKLQRTELAPGSWHDRTAARTASIACGRGKVTRQTSPTVRLG